MVARLKPGVSLSRNFYYNENKVKEGVAIRLLAENYPKKMGELNQKNRLEFLQKQAGLNTRTKVNSLHVSLNFDPSEKISEGIYKEIAKAYMDRLGFGGQPYLVYQHFDAGHPHLHILTTNIQADGSRINLHHLGIRKSEPARKELELIYNLVKAEGRNLTKSDLKPAYIPRVVYGEVESKNAIGAVLRKVLDEYKFASLPELNAILNQYNVIADRGGEGSRTYCYGGLYYKILNKKREPVGVPIKASLFSGGATLKGLEKYFKRNAKARTFFKGRTLHTIDFCLGNRRSKDLRSFEELLKKEGVQMVLRQNKEGIIYGITYVDFRTKCVFNGSDLGNDYSAKGILKRLSVEHGIFEKKALAASQHDAFESNSPKLDIIDVLMQPEQTYTPTPYELKGKKRKRRKL